jgi:polyisoprenoid-binding protein YceI
LPLIASAVRALVLALQQGNGDWRRDRMKPRLITLIAALAVASASPVLHAEDANASASPTIAIKSGTLRMDGKSTLHDFTVATSAFGLRTTLEVPPGETDWTPVLKPGSVKTFELRIPVASLKAEKDGLNKNMYKALKSDKNPEIVLNVERYEVGAPASDVTPLKVAGTLTVAGVTRPVELTLDTKVTPDGLSVEGHQDILMTDFGIDPPKFMLGALQTANKVVISFSLVFGLARS